MHVAVSGYVTERDDCQETESVERIGGLGCWSGFQRSRRGLSRNVAGDARPSDCAR